MSLTVGSLFAGIGGFDLGLDRAGMQIKWQVKKDDYCNKILEKHWPHVRRYGDIHGVGAHNLEPVDVICGGFPCQPVSVAGKQEGTADDRWLWPEMFRVIQELRPAWVIGENVTGLIGLGLDDCVSDLESEGYVCQPFIIPACAVNAPHRRDRVWILGYSVSCGRSGESWRRTGQKFEDRYLQLEAGRVLENTPCKQLEGCKHARGKEGAHAQPARSGKDVPDPNSDGCLRAPVHEGRGAEGEGAFNNCGCGKDVAHTKGLGLQGVGATGEQVTEAHGGPELPLCDGGYGNQWAVEPNVGRVANGVPNRVDRLKALGNAVVPQIPEILGRVILAAEAQGGDGAG